LQSNAINQGDNTMSENTKEEKPIYEEIAKKQTLHAKYQMEFNSTFRPTYDRNTMQWVIVVQSGQDIEIIHQYDIGDTDETSHKNIQVVKDVEEDPDKLLKAMYLIPKNRHMTPSNIADIYPRFAVDFITGQFHINGIAYNVLPENFNPADQKLRFIYYRRVRGSIDVDVSENGREEISNKKQWLHMYILGWQATLPDGKNVQRMIHYDVVKNEISFETKR